MAIWTDSTGGLHDDMDGAALTMPSWPAGLTALTDDEISLLEEKRKNEEAATIQLSSISARLAEIDLLTLRPLRAVSAGTDTKADHDKLAALEAEAVQLRGELNAN